MVIDEIWQLVGEHACQLGESPLYDAINERILWVDILKGEVHQCGTKNSLYKVFSSNLMIGAIALCRSGLLIAATQNGFALIDLEKKNLIGIIDPEKHLEEAGCLYTLEPDFSVSAKIRGVGCSNGIAWSPEGNLMYYIDTLTRQVVSYDFDIINGEISNKRVIIDIPESDGYPDGMTVDSEGMLWIALWDGWRIARYNPVSGKMIHNFRLPVAKISSCTFGGENLQDLYITTAKTGLLPDEIKEQPLAGRLFVIKNSGFQGLNASIFND
jgi:sugar lactone lactonase YvrE